MAKFVLPVSDDELLGRSAAIVDRHNLRDLITDYITPSYVSPLLMQLIIMEVHREVLLYLHSIGEMRTDGLNYVLFGTMRKSLTTICKIRTQVDDQTALIVDFNEDQAAQAMHFALKFGVTPEEGQG